MTYSTRALKLGTFLVLAMSLTLGACSFRKNSNKEQSQIIISTAENKKAVSFCETQLAGDIDSREALNLSTSVGEKDLCQAVSYLKKLSLKKDNKFYILDGDRRVFESLVNTIEKRVGDESESKERYVDIAIWLTDFDVKANGIASAKIANINNLIGNLQENFKFLQLEVFAKDLSPLFQSSNNYSNEQFRQYTQILATQRPDVCESESLKSILKRKKFSSHLIELSNVCKTTLSLTDIAIGRQSVNELVSDNELAFIKNNISLNTFVNNTQNLRSVLVTALVRGDANLYRVYTLLDGTSDVNTFFYMTLAIQSNMDVVKLLKNLTYNDIQIAFTAEAFAKMVSKETCKVLLGLLSTYNLYPVKETARIFLKDFKSLRSQGRVSNDVAQYTYEFLRSNAVTGFMQMASEFAKLELDIILKSKNGDEATYSSIHSAAGFSIDIDSEGYAVLTTSAQYQMSYEVYKALFIDRDISNVLRLSAFIHYKNNFVLGMDVLKHWDNEELNLKVYCTSGNVDVECIPTEEDKNSIYRLVRAVKKNYDRSFVKALNK